VVGGGKSFAVRMKAIILAYKYPGIKQLIVRRTYKELEMNHIAQFKQLLKIGTSDAYAKYNKQEKMLYFPNGSTIQFDYCGQSESDIDHFQGGEWHIIYIDEATTLSEDHLRKITACLRGADDFPKRVYFTCNPGGKSHGYIKRLFIDRQYEEGEKPEDYSFIKSLVTDNKALMRSNEDYLRQLQALPEKLRRAWLEGDWDSFEGAFFAEFRNTPDPMECNKHNVSIEDAKEQGLWTHVIAPFEPPHDWKVYLSYDWGYGHPFSAAFWVQDYDGCLYRIIELYGCTRTPNEGVKWSNKQQFEKIAEIAREHPWLKGKYIHGVADPSIWDGSKGISAAEEADKQGIFFEPGVNDRIAGWMQVHERLKFDENGRAMMYFFDTCKAAIRTMPLMMFDEHKVEDLDTDLEDHACLVGETLVLTDEGYKPISEMVGTEGYVMSSDGEYHKYHDCVMTKAQADVYEVELEDGTKIVGTVDHPIMLEDGSYCNLGELLGKDVYASKCNK